MAVRLPRELAALLAACATSAELLRATLSLCARLLKCGSGMLQTAAAEALQTAASGEGVGATHLQVRVWRG